MPPICCFMGQLSADQIEQRAGAGGAADALGRTATLRGTLIATQATQATHSHQQSAYSFCLLLEATQPPTIPTSNTPTNLNLRMRNHSPSRNQPTTTSSKLKQPATNFHHAPLQQLATNKHYNLNQRTNQLEADTLKFLKRSNK